MSNYEYVETAIWSDPVFEALPAPAKVVYFWSFTSSHCNLAGLYKVSKRIMGVETGLTCRALDRALGQLAEAGLVHHEPPLLWVRARVKYLHTHNASVARSIHKCIKNLDPEHVLVQAFLFTHQNAAWLKAELADFKTPASNPLLGWPRVPVIAGKAATNGVV